MQKSLVRKGIVLGIIVILIGVSITPIISGDIKNISYNDDKIEEEHSAYQTENREKKSSRDIDWWPMFHHDSQNSGYSTSEAPDTNSTFWSFTTAESFDHSPAVFADRVYCGATSKVYCLDANDGSFVWSNENVSSNEAPAVVNGKIYCGHVCCLDANDGSLIWSTSLGFRYDASSPVVYNGKVYIGDFINLYCLDADNGSIIWSYPTGYYVSSSPAVADGKVYVGSYDNNVYCLDADDGSLVWSYETGYAVQSSPAVVNGKVYVGSWDWNVYCLDADDGSLVWSYETGYPVLSSPAVAYGKVFVGSRDDRVYCLDADNGSLIWSYLTLDLVDSAPAVSDNKVFVTSTHGKLHCLDADDGNLIWSYDTGDYLHSSPAVADGKVYLGSDAGLICFGDEDENQPPIFTINEITYKENPTIQNKGKYITYYQINNPSAEITINDPDGYLQVTQPNSQGIFTTYVDTELLSLTPPTTLHINPTDISVEIDGYIYDLSPDLFSYALHVQQRDYSTFWDAKKTSYLGGSLACILFGAENSANLRLKYDNNDVLRIQRLHDDKGIVGLGIGTPVGLDLEAGDVEIHASAGVKADIYGKIIRESGIVESFANPSLIEKITVALYLLSSIPSLIGGYVSSSIGQLISFFNWILEVLGVISYPVEYDGIGFGYGAEVQGNTFDADIPGYNGIPFDITKPVAGIIEPSGSGDARIGGDFIYKNYPIDNFKRYIFQLFYEYNLDIELDILGFNVIDEDDYDSYDYKRCGLEIDDYSNTAIGKWFEVHENGDNNKLDTKKVCYDFNDIKNTDLYDHTVGFVKNPNPLDPVKYDPFKWRDTLVQFINEFRNCDVTVEKNLGTIEEVSGAVSLEIPGVIGIDVSAGGGFGYANEFLVNEGVIKNYELFFTKSYPELEPSITTTRGLISLLSEIFLIPEIQTLFLYLLAMAGDFALTLMNTAIDAAEITIDFLEDVTSQASKKALRIAGAAVDSVTQDVEEIAEDPDSYILDPIGSTVKIVWNAGTTFFEELWPLSRGNNTVDMRVIIYNNTYNWSEELDDNPARIMMDRMQGIDFTASGVFELQPLNVSFSPSAQIWMNYTDEMVEGVDESKLCFYQWQPEDLIWQPLDSNVDIVNNNVSCYINRFGTFLIGCDDCIPDIQIPGSSRYIATYFGNISFTAFISDNGTGINMSSLTLMADDQPFNFSYDKFDGVLKAEIDVPAGYHNISIIATDMANNSANSTVMVRNIEPCEILSIEKDININNQMINISWISQNGTYPVDNYKLLFDNGNYIVTSNTYFNSTLNFSQLIVIPVDTMGYNGSSKSISIFHPIPIIGVWDKGNKSIEFNASSSFDVDGEITSLFWDLGDGNISSNVSFIHQYQNEGIYNVSLTVWDNDGLNTTFLRNVNVENLLPVVNFSFSPSNPSTMDIVQFNDTSFDRDGGISQWSWDFGDGNSSDQQNPIYQYVDVDIYLVTLTVTDSEGKTNSISRNITVLDGTPPKISNVQAIPSVQNIGGYVNISATVIDNIEVDEVYLYLEYPDSSVENFSITQNKTGDTYYCNKTYDYPGVYTYHIWANDTSNNHNITGDYTFEIINQPPYTPSNPSPEDGTTDVNIDVDISWDGGDPDPGDTVTYDVYFGDSSPPPQVATGQSDTSYDPGTLEYSTTYYWKIVAWDNHGASTEGSIWDFTTEEEPIPDLDCSGSLSWTDVTPGDTVSGSITVENIGDPESLLDWEIDHYPDWGTWSFDPESGMDLEEGDTVTIDVEVFAPDEPEETFTGEVVLVNSEDPDDTCIIDVSLATPVNQQVINPLLQMILERFPNAFPILRQLLGL